MRALVITLTLAMIVALLVGTLVVFGGVRVDQALLASLGGGLFMVAVLFAAISALGPKYGPTPALTPIMAGTTAAAFASALVLVANLQLSAGPAARAPCRRTGADGAGRAGARSARPAPPARTVEPEEPPPPPIIGVARPPQMTHQRCR